MSTVSVNDLPGMLADEQRADSIKKGLRGGKVMALEKWESCVNQAISNGDLSICCERRIEVATVNEWLKSKELDLWSLFTLHDPLLPDLEDLFELSYEDLPNPIKNRLDRRFNKESWDKLSPELRRHEVNGEDETNAPHHRLFFALGELIVWGDGKTLDQVAADDGDSAFVNRLSDLRERPLGNEDIGPEVSTTELAQVLIDGKAKWPSCRVIFPTWLDQLALDTNRQPPAQLPSVPGRLWDIEGTWQHKARRIGKAWMEQEKILAANGSVCTWQNKKAMKCPGVIAIAKHVEGALSTENVTGKRGKYLDFETIKKEALTGITGNKKTGKG
jgi:hypothetical protein